MIMQPAYSASGRGGFPRRTFKSLAGITLALGLAVVILGVAEVIYSVKSVRKCENAAWMKEFGLESEDDVHTLEIRKKRSHMDGRPDGMPPPRGGRHRPRPHQDSEEWVRDALVASDEMFADRSTSSDGDDRAQRHLEWLTDAVFSDEPGMRCIMFSVFAGCLAVVNAACGVVFVVTGSLGIGAARTAVAHRQSGLKTGYMVMNILCVLGFAPTIFMLSGYIANIAPVIAEDDGYYLGHVVPAHLTALFGAALGVLCLIAASVSCCCAPTHEQVQVVTMAAPLHQKPAPIDPAHVQLRVDEKAQLVNNEASA